jgi:hypothetical protein
MHWGNSISTFLLLMAHGMSGAAHAAKEPLDLRREAPLDRELTYNLGATGLRGWMHSVPATHFDGLQGRTTGSARQILVTHVGTGSPADRLMRVGDVVLGVGGRDFSGDARKELARAIQRAESGESGGELGLTVQREDEVLRVPLRLAVLGSYAKTAPWGCAKSAKILEVALGVLAREKSDPRDWAAPVSGLALLAGGRAEDLGAVRELARSQAAMVMAREERKGDTWVQGYRNLFLCEYHLATGDAEVLPAIRSESGQLARGQSLYGTYGHGFAGKTSDGKLHGSVPPYGPVNMAGLPANLSLVLAQKCGVRDGEIDGAVERAAGFLGYFVDKGAIPYGEHEPWPYHENNGKNSIAAVFFAALGGHGAEATFFAKMATAGHRSRECGHTGQGFSYLWSALGAGAGGPAAAAAFFAEASWHLDLVRRSDGSFTYDGGEQYGPGTTEDGTYFGRSSYYGLSPAACYVLTYAMPLQKLVITGRGFDPAARLSEAAAAGAVASGCFDLERKKKTDAELMEAFRDWSPVVRSWAAEELAGRPGAGQHVGALVRLAESGSVHEVQGACEALGLLKAAEGLPVLVRRLGHEDRWVRYKAAAAVRAMGKGAAPVLPDLLKALAETAEPLRPVNWQDPVQIAHGQLAAAVFAGPLKELLGEADPVLLYPAVRSVARNPDGMARATLREFFEHRITLEQAAQLAPDILEALAVPGPADTMFGNEIRMGAFRALTKYRFREGMEAGVAFAMTQGGHGSESRTGEIMEALVGYGRAARPVIPKLRALMEMFLDEAQAGEFPGGELNERRVSAVREAIRKIEAAADEPGLRSVGVAGK